MTVEAFPQQNTLLIGVSGEADPVQVVGFAFLKISTRPYINQGWHRRIFAWRLRLEYQCRAAARAVSVVDHLHAVFNAEIIDAGRAGKIIESQLITHRLSYINQMRPVNDDTRIALTGIILDDLREFLLQIVDGIFNRTRLRRCELLVSHYLAFSR